MHVEHRGASDQTVVRRTSEWWRGRSTPWVIILATLVAAALQLRAQGRLYAGGRGRFIFWVGDAWSSDTSQGLFDPYSFTHVLHGTAFCGLLTWGLPRLSWTWRLCLAVIAEAVWEIIENTDFVINRYREATAALGYTGDSVVNALGDILCCGLGFLVARRLGWIRSIILFVVTEVMLLVWIRDSLLLNILMLIYPVDEIRAWQSSR